jgi:hypothetical protein
MIFKLFSPKKSAKKIGVSGAKKHCWILRKADHDICFLLKKRKTPIFSHKVGENRRKLRS